MQHIPEETLTAAAQNAFRCLRIHEGEGHKLVVYGHDRTTKGSFADRLLHLAESKGVPAQSMWLEEYDKPGMKASAIAEQLVDKAQRFFSGSDPMQRNLIDISTAGPVREAFVKGACVETIGAYALSAPTETLGPLVRLLGPQNNPNEAWRYAENLITDLRQATAYRIKCQEAELVLPWSSQDFQWVISVGDIKRQRKKYDPEGKNPGYWGNPGAEIFTSGYIERATGELGFDGTIESQRIFDDHAVFVPVERGVVQVDDIYGKGQRARYLVERTMQFFRSKADTSPVPRIAEIPAIGLSRCDYTLDGTLSLLEIEKFMPHTGFLDPEASRGTIVNPDLVWKGPDHGDFTMRTGCIDMRIDDGPWIPVVEAGTPLPKYLPTP